MIDTTTPISSVTYNGTSIPLASGSQGEFKVEFRDIDGTLLKTEFVNSGESVTPPATPTFDSDYLEFDYWAVSGGDSLDNITRDTLVMPQYKTKQDNSINNERPTYLFCWFGANLTPELYFKNYTDAYIDWGDGSSAEQVTSNTISHTYANSGKYLIKVYGNSYTVGGSSTAGIFTNSAYYYSLLKAYCGEHFSISGSGNYIFYNCQALQLAVLPSSATGLPMNCFNVAKSLENLVIPTGATIVNENSLRNCYGLKYLIVPNTVTGIQSSCLSACCNLKSLVVPSSVTTTFQSDIYYLSYCLESLNIPTTQYGMNNAAFSWALKNLTLGVNYNFKINLSRCSVLSKKSLINIANNLKDNTGATAKTINFHNAKESILNLTYLNSSGEEVSSDTVGANNLATIITNKNWTISYSSPSAT